MGERSRSESATLRTGNCRLPRPGGDGARPSGNLSASSGPTIRGHGEGPEASKDVHDADERDVVLGTERQVSGPTPVRSCWPEKRPGPAVNDIVATESNPVCSGRPRGVAAQGLLLTPTCGGMTFSRLVVGASDRLGGSVGPARRAVFEPWFAEAGASVHAVTDETVSSVPAHHA